MPDCWGFAFGSESIGIWLFRKEGIRMQSASPDDFKLSYGFAGCSSDVHWQPTRVGVLRCFRHILHTCVGYSMLWLMCKELEHLFPLWTITLLSGRRHLSQTWWSHPPSKRPGVAISSETSQGIIPVYILFSILLQSLPQISNCKQIFKILSIASTGINTRTVQKALPLAFLFANNYPLLCYT